VKVKAAAPVGRQRRDELVAERFPDIADEVKL
jgi:hypothetical protein